MGILRKGRDYFLPVCVLCKGNENRVIEEWLTERQFGSMGMKVRN